MEVILIPDNKYRFSAIHHNNDMYKYAQILSLSLSLSHTHTHTHTHKRACDQYLYIMEFIDSSGFQSVVTITNIMNLSYSDLKKLSINLD